MQACRQVYKGRQALNSESEYYEKETQGTLNHWENGSDIPVPLLPPTLTL